MDSEHIRRRFGIGALIAAGGLFARETVIWLWNKGLDTVVGLFSRESVETTITGFPWLNTFGLVLMIFGFMALFAENWIRKNRPKQARLALLWEDKWEPSKLLLRENIYEYFWQSRGSDVLILLIFQSYIKDGYILVWATSQSVRWKESALSDRHVVIEIEGREKDSEILIEVFDKSIIGAERQQQANVWQSAVYKKA
jgi:hypothetical protein